MRASLKLDIPIHAVHGNNIGDVAALYRMMAKTNGLFTYYGEEAVLELGGRRVFVTHMPHHGTATQAGLDGRIIQPKKLHDIAEK